MTEFWVSQERHYCKYCNIWCGSDKTSITHHETSWKHKNNVKKYIRDAQRKEINEKKDEDKLQRELTRIQQAANASYQNDLKNAQEHYNSGKSSKPSQSTSSKPPSQSNSYPQSFPQQPTAPVFNGTRLEMSEKQSSIDQMKAFYLSRGIALPTDYDSTENVQSTPSFQPPPIPTQPIQPPVATDDVSDDISDFKEFYKKFFAQHQQGKSVEDIAKSLEIEDNESNDKEEVQEDVVEEDGDPYGEWEEVVREVEDAKNQPITLVEDSFTQADPYLQRRKFRNQVSYEDSDDEEQDKDISALESKDTSTNSLYGDSSDEEDLSKPVVFKKRKRKADKKGNIRKRRTLTQITE